MSNPLFGVPVVVDKNALESRWHFPVRRFVEYEKKDEQWARKIGYGHATYHPGAFMVGGKLVVHPDVYEQMKKEFKQV